MRNEKLVQYVNEHYDIRDLYEKVMGREAGYGKCFCPFHDNHNTPAAKIYQNNLKCFGLCNRLFSCYDMLKKFFPEELRRVESTIVLPDVTEVHKKLVYVKKEELLGLNKFEMYKLIKNRYEASKSKV